MQQKPLKTTIYRYRGRAITQAISYIPYGEVFVEQQAGGWSSPYLFNAKELDSETGLYYYGARYLDPSDAMWLSVDPLWEKYVGMTPYQYCMGNPVRLVDTDGRTATEGLESKLQEFEKKIETKIKETKNSTAKSKEQTLNELNKIKDEIQAIRISEQVYDIQYYESGPQNGIDSRGRVTYDLENDQFVICINKEYENDENMTEFAHELTHAYQFETGRMSFKVENGKVVGGGRLYDYTDEEEAHKRGHMFDACGKYPDHDVYKDLKTEETHIGKDNEIQYEYQKTKKNNDLLKDNIYHYRK